MNSYLKFAIYILLFLFFLPMGGLIVYETINVCKILLCYFIDKGCVDFSDVKAMEIMCFYILVLSIHNIMSKNNN